VLVVISIIGVQTHLVRVRTIVNPSRLKCTVSCDLLTRSKAASHRPHKNESDVEVRDGLNDISVSEVQTSGNQTTIADHKEVILVLPDT
jgi:hypothetical protein